MTEIVEKHSDNYGLIKYEFAGNVDYDFLAHLPFEDYYKWSELYHPTRYFLAFFWTEAEKTDLGRKLERAGVESENIDLYVCVDDINEDWDCSFWLSKYPELGKRKRKLPVAISRKRLDKWKTELERVYELACETKQRKGIK